MFAKIYVYILKKVRDLRKSGVFLKRMAQHTIIKLKVVINKR